MSTFLLEIFTPFGKYFDRYVEELVIQTDDYVLGILPNHTPLVSKVKISKMYIIQNGDKKCYAIGEGLLNISKDGVCYVGDAIQDKKTAINAGVGAVLIDRNHEYLQLSVKRLKNECTHELFQNGLLLSEHR